MSSITLPDLNSIVLKRGGHNSREEGTCATEATAWLAGEPHTAYPKCMCPFLGAYVRRLNDTLDDEPRQRLIPYLPRLIGTAGDTPVLEARLYLAADWIIRKRMPVWMRLIHQDAIAEELENLAPVTNTGSQNAARPALALAREAADAFWRAEYMALAALAARADLAALAALAARAALAALAALAARAARAARADLAALAARADLADLAARADLAALAALKKESIESAFQLLDQLIEIKAAA